MTRLNGFLAAAGLLTLAAPTFADMITYDTWSTNEDGSGNYLVTVDDETPGQFNVEVTVEPWNAEVLGLFVDFGDFDLIVPIVLATSDAVAVYATDTTSGSIGQGGNLNGLNPPIADPDQEWEIVFRFGSQGFDGLQTFMFSINDFGLTLDDWGVIGIRAQNYCGSDETLPDGDCGGSDKSYGFSGDGHMDVTEPGTLALLGLGLLGLSLGRRRRA